MAVGETVVDFFGGPWHGHRYVLPVLGDPPEPPRLLVGFGYAPGPSGGPAVAVQRRGEYRRTVSALDDGPLWTYVWEGPGDAWVEPEEEVPPAPDPPLAPSP